MLRPTSMEKSPRIEPADEKSDKNARITWKRGLWVGLAEHHTAHFDDVLALPDHGADWARVHVLDESGEETLERVRTHKTRLQAHLAGEVLVVLLEVLLARSAQFHCNQFVAALLESLDDLANESALDTVGFDSDKSTFSGHSLNFFKFKKSSQKPK